MNKKHLFSEGVDECDTAALQYDCGRQEAPEVMTDIVNTLELAKGVIFCGG
jgi:hypothetical protein